MKAIIKKQFALGYIILIIICMLIGFFGGVWYVHHTETTVYPPSINCRMGYTFYAEPLNRCVPNGYYNSCFGGAKTTEGLCPL